MRRDWENGKTAAGPRPTLKSRMYYLYVFISSIDLCSEQDYIVNRGSKCRALFQEENEGLH